MEKVTEKGEGLEPEKATEKDENLEPEEEQTTVEPVKLENQIIIVKKERPLMEILIIIGMTTIMIFGAFVGILLAYKKICKDKGPDA